MKKRVYFIAISLIVHIYSFAQVGIGTKTPDSLAALHITSKDKGLIIPSVSDFQEMTTKIEQYSSDQQDHVKGIIVFNETDSLYYYWVDETRWICLNPIVGEIDVNTNLRSQEYNYNLEIAYPYESLTGELKGNFEGTGKLDGDFTGSNNSTFNGYGSVPIGGIIMWSGTEIPEGFLLCDGACYNLDGTLHSRDGYGCYMGRQSLDLIQTPNLSGRFIAGYGPSTSGYNNPGNYSEQVRNLTDNVVNPSSGGYATVRLEPEEVAPHDHDVIEYAHNHNITGEIMQKDGSSTKQVVAIETQADPQHGNRTYNNKIGSTTTGIVVKRGGGNYTYDEIPNPPYRDPSCNIWQYTCTTSYGGTFQSSVDLEVIGTFSQNWDYVELPSVPGEYGYRVCEPTLNYCGIGFTENHIGTNINVTGCTLNGDYESANPQCLSEHHDPNAPVGETIRINENWTTDAHENRPPFYSLGYIMRYR